MERFLVFAGTTEGNRALELLHGGGRALWASVATEYGGQCLPRLPGLTVLSGRLDGGAVRALLERERFTCVLDATHPFAKEATENIRAACEGAGTPYVRVLRDEDGAPEGCIRVESAQAAARWLLENTQGNILLTTGSKELSAFTPLFPRLYARVLPAQGSLEQCLTLGLPAKQVICMQGPFTAELNAAMLRQVGARWLVTKETGATGGFPEKCAGALEAGARVLVIARPQEQGVPISRLAVWLMEHLGLPPASTPIAAPAKAPAEPSSAAAPAPAPAAPPYFPLFVSLAGKTTVVLGGGKIAARRALALARFGCRVRVVAPEICAEIAEHGGLELVRRRYAPGDCAGAALVVAATNEREANAAAARECAALGVPVSVADARQESTFYFPGIVQEGGVTVGLTASGANHGLARGATERLRAEAKRLFGACGEEQT